jgi:thiosulfate/3-mercaptopyruvate sulfurtransferase
MPTDRFLAGRATSWIEKWTHSGSINIPYTQLLKDGKFYLRSVKEILSVPEKPLMFTCGSGVTACINMIAYELVSDNSKAIYDGSWTEWGQRKITN